MPHPFGGKKKNQHGQPGRIPLPWKSLRGGTVQSDTHTSMQGDESSYQHGARRETRSSASRATATVGTSIGPWPDSSTLHTGNPPASMGLHSPPNVTRRNVPSHTSTSATANSTNPPRPSMLEVDIPRSTCSFDDNLANIPKSIDEVKTLRSELGRQETHLANEISKLRSEWTLLRSKHSELCADCRTQMQQHKGAVELLLQGQAGDHVNSIERRYTESDGQVRLRLAKEAECITLSEKLHIAEHDLREKDAEIINAKRELHEAKEQLERTKSNLTMEITKLRSACEKSGKQEQHHQLLSREKDDKIEYLQASCTTLENAYLEIQTLNNILGADLERLKHESRDAHRDDDFFRGQWMNLQADVDHWAKDFFSGPLLQSKFHEESHYVQIPRELEELSEDAPALLGSNNLRQHIAAAYVWSVIQYEVMDSLGDLCKGMFWAPSRRGNFAGLQRRTKPGGGATDNAFRDYFKWRATTTKLLVTKSANSADYDGVAIDEGLVKDLVDYTYHVLNPYLCRDDDGQLTMRLRRIIVQAAQLDASMSQQWSFLYPATSSIFPEKQLAYGFTALSGLLESISYDHPFQPGQVVGLTVAPALVKLGSGEGENYTSALIIAPGSALPTLPHLGSHKPNRSSSTRVGEAISSRLHKKLGGKSEKPIAYGTA